MRVSWLDSNRLRVVEWLESAAPVVSTASPVKRTLGEKAGKSQSSFFTEGETGVGLSLRLPGKENGKVGLNMRGFGGTLADEKTIDLVHRTNGLHRGDAWFYQRLRHG